MNSNIPIMQQQKLETVLLCFLGELITPFPIDKLSYESEIFTPGLIQVGFFKYVYISISIHIRIFDFKCLTHGVFEPRHEKTRFLHMRKQRHRSASR